MHRVLFIFDCDDVPLWGGGGKSHISPSNSIRNQFEIENSKRT